VLRSAFMESTLTSGPPVRPECFGNPAKVCPRDGQGFMEPQPSCLPCPVLKSCLQVSLRKYGLVSPPPPSEQITSGLIGFVKRWSDRKLAQHGETGGGADDDQ
jgi:hypothetical protein